ncbi:MAG: hypothetical protein AB9869_04375 [Verrucomicrobiia bacterium]
MKTLRLIVFGALVAELISLPAATAQVYSPRRITQRVAPQVNPAQTNPAAAKVAPAPAGNTPATATAPAVSSRTQPPRPVVRIVPPPPQDPAKVRAEKEATTRRVVEFQKKRATEGSASAQYELGTRYLKGDGVEKDEAVARKWLESSAKAGYDPAIKKLQELDRVAQPAQPAQPTQAPPP